MPVAKRRFGLSGPNVPVGDRVEDRQHERVVVRREVVLDERVVGVPEGEPAEVGGRREHGKAVVEEALHDLGLGVRTERFERGRRPREAR